MDKKIKKPIWKKWWVWVIAVIIVGGIGASGGESEDGNTVATDNNVTDVASNENNGDAESEKKDDKAKNKDKEEKSAKIKAGTYKIGTDLPAGEYVFIAKKMGYIEVASDSTGELASIITNDNVTGHTYITVNDGEYLKLKGGEAYAVNDAPSLVPEDGIYKSGKYLVGKDIPAGEYKVTVKSGFGYIEVSSNSRGTLDSIVSNDNLMEDSYITVQDGQYLKLTGAEIDTN